MFPSREGRLPPLPKMLHPPQAQELTLRLLDTLPQLRFKLSPSALRERLQDAQRYSYLRDSPYLPADRFSKQRAFSLAVGEVLMDERLSQVKHANGVYDGRYALYLPGGDRVELDLELSPGAQFSSAAVLLPSQGEQPRCGATLKISLKQAGSWQLLKELKLSTLPFHWRPLEIPLNAEGPAQLSLEVERASGCKGPAQLFLADPRILQPSVEPPLNLLYLNLCTVRAKDFGFMGQKRPSSPRIDALAKESLVFGQARSNANWSKASQTSALLGRYPSSIGNKYFWGAVGAFERSSYTHLAWPGLPTILRRQGYETLALVDNIFIADYLHVGMDLGFARFYDNMKHIWNASEIVAQTGEFLEARGQRPFFLYLNLANAHARYRPPREDLLDSGFGLEDLLGSDAQLQEALHLGEIRYTDRLVGQLLDLLETLKLRERTLIVLHGDHGELMSPLHNLEVSVRSAGAPREVSYYGPTLYKHGWTWYEEELRIPMLLSLPGRVPVERREGATSPIDLAPTILEILKIPAPESLQGRSLLSDPGPRSILIEGKQFRALIQGEEKLVSFLPSLSAWRLWGTEEWRTPQRYLFDLNQDPQEQKDLSAARPQRLKELEQALRAARPPLSALHLLNFTGPEGQHFSGELHLSAPLLSAVLRDHGAGDRLHLEGDRLSFSIQTAPKGSPPPTLALSAQAPLEEIDLEIQLNGLPLKAEALLLGPYGLPLLQGKRPTRLNSTLIRALGVGAEQIPRRKQEPQPVLRWWSQRILEGGPQPFGAVNIDESVMDAMKDWGYAK